MKFILFFFVSLYSLCITSVAQKLKLYTIKPGDNILEQVPKEDWYQYPQFQKGAVNFINGFNSIYSLNYNYLFGEMFFIGQNGDTLTVVNPDEIRFIVIADDEFFYEGTRFIKLDTTVGDIKLATATFFGIYSQRKIGTYGTTEDGSSMNYLYVQPSAGKLDMVPHVTTLIGKQHSFFIGNKFNRFTPVTKKTVFAFYQNERSQLKQYIKKKRVNFSSRHDVLELIIFMSQF